MHLASCIQIGCMHPPKQFLEIMKILWYYIKLLALPAASCECQHAFTKQTVTKNMLRFPVQEKGLYCSTYVMWRRKMLVENSGWDVHVHIDSLKTRTLALSDVMTCNTYRSRSQFRLISMSFFTSLDINCILSFKKYTLYFTWREVY